MNQQINQPWRKGILVSILVFIFASLYSFVRYNILRDVPYAEIPLFIMNKAISLSSIIIIGFSFLLGPLAGMFHHRFTRYVPLRKPLGLIGFGLASVHAVVSLILLSSSEYYGKFYTESGAFSALGQFSLLFGVLALAIFSVVAITSLPAMYEQLGEKTWKKVQRFGYLGYLFVLLHVVIMGARGWIDPKSYVYGFISITLLSSLFIIFVFLVRIIARAHKCEDCD